MVAKDLFEFSPHTPLIRASSARRVPFDEVTRARSSFCGDSLLLMLLSFIFVSKKASLIAHS